MSQPHSHQSHGYKGNPKRRRKENIRYTKIQVYQFLGMDAHRTEEKKHKKQPPPQMHDASSTHSESIITP
jgi:hypothetical protein